MRNKKLFHVDLKVMAVYILRILKWTMLNNKGYLVIHVNHSFPGLHVSIYILLRLASLQLYSCVHRFGTLILCFKNPCLKKKPSEHSIPLFRIDLRTNPETLILENSEMIMWCHNRMLGIVYTWIVLKKKNRESTPCVKTAFCDILSMGGNVFSSYRWRIQR